MFNNIFKIVYFIELILITTVRSVGTVKYRRETIKVDRSNVLDSFLLALNGVGMIIPIFYVFTARFDFADYSLPAWLSWVGVALFAGAAVLLWQTHQALGRSWTPTLGLREDHQLVTEGVFKYIRHPMYAAHLLWALATPLILTNWIAGYAMLIPQIVQFWLRIGVEERMMLERFGESYREYMTTTGRLLPRFFGGKSTS
jgi:protein-S-isoprenylcysteine O-methyltransferase Ste14